MNSIEIHAGHHGIPFDGAGSAQAGS